MPIDRKIFFDHVRAAPGGGFLGTAQVDGFTKILDEWERRKLSDTRWLAYILATVWHETDKAMQPIEEAGGPAYLKSKPYYPWYGRGLVQITWQKNYVAFGITNAADALTWPVALKVLFDGMINGSFTGVGLGRYFSATVNDPVNARRIVNGTDKAQEIAGYHASFLAAITAASALAPAPAPIPKPATLPPVITPAPKPVPTRWQRFKSALGLG